MINTKFNKISNDLENISEKDIIIDNKPKVKKEFRICSKSLYLTYPNCDLDNQIILKYFKEILSSRIIKDYFIVREFHKDGSPHIHVYLKLHKPFNTYKQNSLDIIINNNIFHGNYQSAKNPNNIIQYLLKDITNKYDNNLLFSDSLSNRIDLLGTWLDYPVAMLKLAREGKIEEALKLYELEKPLDFIKNHVKITKSLNNLYYKTIGMKLKFNFNDFIIPDELKEIISAINSNKTPIIIGRPGIGKTSWLIAFLKEIMNLNPLVINNKDSLRFFNPDNHSAIVYDDCSWPEDINREELIKLIDSEQPTTHNIKHGSVIINKPTPRFVIVNNVEPWLINYNINNNYQDNAVTRRIKHFLIKKDSTLIKN